jgi:hypothetical protein
MKYPQFIRRLWSLIIVASSLVFSGCASPPPALDMSQLPKAAETVLQEALYHNSLFNTCMQLGGDAEIAAITKQQDWLAANWKLVAAADAVYSEAYTNESFNYNSKPLLPQALRIAQKANEKAIQELKLSTRTHTNQQITCKFRLSKITPQNIHLTHIPLVATYEQTMLAKAPANLPQINNIPTLAAGIAMDVPPGKSHFKIIRENEKECDDASTLIIASDWPHEAYANFCGDELLQVLICEWGNCQPK